ncbi:MAG: DUF4350 domain-containing protein [Halobacteriaceae archaeon]
MPDERQAVGVIVTTVAIVLAVVVLSSVLTAGAGGFEAITVDHPEFEPASLIADRPEATGSIDPSVDASGQVVLIDEAHRNQFSRAEMKPLLHAFTEAGFTVRFLTETGNFAGELAAADVFVVMTPRNSYTRSQVAAVNEFTGTGGQLILVGEPTQARVVRAGLQAGIVRTDDRPAALARSYGITYRSRYIYNLRTYAGVYRNVFARPSASSPLTDGVDRVATYIATAVTATDGHRVLETGANTHIAGTGATRSRGVVVRTGNVVAISDQTLFTVDRFANADNDVFIENLVEYVATH